MKLINDYFIAENMGCTAIFATSSLNFNPKTESASNVKANYKKVAQTFCFDAEKIIKLDQVHTDNIIVAGETAREGDALITNEKGILLSVRTADCVPILLHDVANGAVAAVHAGWRGTFLQIATKTVRRMGELYGTRPADIKAAIGAAIGICCYEVSTEFYDRFRNEFGKAIEGFFTVKEKPHCDLKAMNKAFLIEAGVTEQNMDVSGLCTKCNPDLFFSHRQSGEKRGVMAAFIGIKEEF